MILICGNSEINAMFVNIKEAYLLFLYPNVEYILNLHFKAIYILPQGLLARNLSSKGQHCRACRLKILGVSRTNTILKSLTSVFNF